MLLSLIDLLTPEQVANELNLSSTLIRRYCRQGRLGQKLGGRYLITRQELDKFKAIPRKVGKPKKKE